MRQNIIALLILLIALSGESQCLLSDTDSIEDFIEQLSRREGWKKRMDGLKSRLPSGKKSYAVDSLYKYARNYFEQRLPEIVRCQRVDVTGHSWLSVNKSSINMYFYFYLDDEVTDNYAKKIKVSFQYNIKENEISVYGYDDFWIPDCRTYPDSCRFLVSNYNQAEKIAKEIGFISEANRGLTSRYSEVPPFHYVISKRVDDDCSGQSLFINVYDGSTTISPVFKSTYCQTWEEKLENSDLVVDATVLHEGTCLLNGTVYSMVDLEVHHLLKGQLSECRSLRVITEGGTCGGISTSLSHGQKYLGQVKGRYLFLLNRNSKYVDMEALLGVTPYEATVSAYDFIYGDAEDLLRKSPEEQLSRIESLTGQKRKRLVSPQNMNQASLLFRNNIPDREPGIILDVQVKKWPKKEGLMALVFRFYGTNSYHYVEEMEIHVAYNAQAFGPYLVKNNRISSYLEMNQLNLINTYYKINVSDLSADTLLVSIKRNLEVDKNLAIKPAKIISKHGVADVVWDIAVQDETAALNLSVEFVKAPLAWDFVGNKLYPLTYQYVTKALKASLEEY